MNCNRDGAVSSGMWEIEEVADEEAVAGPPQHLSTSSSVKAVDGDDVYIAIGKGSSSMDALSWALKNIAKPTSFVYLVHVFPVVHLIPTPLGMMPKSQLSREQVESYMDQERAKRREMLQKFLNLCQTSRVQVDIFLIESDQIVSAIIELIPVLHIKMLVVGTAKSNLKRRRGNTKAEQIHKNAPHSCEVKIICEGKEINTTDATPPPSPPPTNTMINKNKENSKSRPPPPPSNTMINKNKENSKSPPPLSSPSRDNTDAKNRDKEQKSKIKDSIFLRCFSGKSTERSSSSWLSFISK